MKPSIYLSILIIAASLVGWFVLQAQKIAPKPVTPEFDADDNIIYNAMRQHLLSVLGTKYGGWFDELVADKYNSGTATLNGRKSKSAAFYAIYQDHKGDADYSKANRQIAALYNNLKTRYK